MGGIDFDYDSDYSEDELDLTPTTPRIVDSPRSPRSRIFSRFLDDMIKKQGAGRPFTQELSYCNMCGLQISESHGVQYTVTYPIKGLKTQCSCLEDDEEDEEDEYDEPPSPVRPSALSKADRSKASMYSRRVTKEVERVTRRPSISSQQVPKQLTRATQKPIATGPHVVVSALPHGGKQLSLRGPPVAAKVTPKYTPQYSSENSLAPPKPINAVETEATALNNVIAHWNENCEPFGEKLRVQAKGEEYPGMPRFPADVLQLFGSPPRQSKLSWSQNKPRHVRQNPPVHVPTLRETLAIATSDESWRLRMFMLALLLLGVGTYKYLQALAPIMFVASYAIMLAQLLLPVSLAAVCSYAVFEFLFPGILNLKFIQQGGVDAFHAFQGYAMYHLLTLLVSTTEVVDQLFCPVRMVLDKDPKAARASGSQTSDGLLAGYSDMWHLELFYQCSDALTRLFHGPVRQLLCVIVIVGVLVFLDRVICC